MDKCIRCNYDQIRTKQCQHDDFGKLKIQRDPENRVTGCNGFTTRRTKVERLWTPLPVDK